MPTGTITPLSDVIVQNVSNIVGTITFKGFNQCNGMCTQFSPSKIHHPMIQKRRLFPCANGNCFSVLQAMESIVGAGVFVSRDPYKTETCSICAIVL